jgi:hypothetical protein
MLRAFAFAVVALAGACNWTGAAQDTFARRQSCPADRVIATRRADVQPSGAAPSAMPADVEADPERRELWLASERERRDRASRVRVYEVEGCGVSRLYACHINQRVSSVYCSEL